MEVILKEDVEKLGHRGDVVKVADGYGRNYLLPSKLAIQATAANKAVIEQMKQSAVRKLAKERVVAEDLSKQLESVELVFERKVPTRSVHVGDIITFRDPDKRGIDVTHRVHAIHASLIVTKGDANRAPDAWRIKRTGSMWRRVYSVPRVGYAVGALRTRAGRLAVMLLPVYILAGLLLMWTWRPLLKRAGGRQQPAASGA